MLIQLQSLSYGFLPGSCHYSNFSVRPVCSSDTDNLARFVHDLNGSTDLLLDTQRYLDAKRDPLSEGSTPLYVLVAECSGQLVGVCVIRDEEVLITHFNAYFCISMTCKFTILH